MIERSRPAVRTPDIRVAVATSAGMSHVDEDRPLLLAALAEAGIKATARVWDDPAVDWAECDLVLVRSTWDYHHRPAEFLTWVDSLPAVSNPAEILRWNADKRYLTDLASAGVPVVPTIFVEPIAALVLPEPWQDDIVVKPAISASATDTARFSRSDVRGITELADRLLAANRVLMVQPYLRAIETAGETSMVFLAGQFSHALRRAPLLTRSAPATVAPGVPEHSPATPTAQQLAVARTALAAVPGGPARLTYARIDLVPDNDGQPRVSELELIEPGLWLGYAAPAVVTAFASAIADLARAARAGRS